MHRHMLFEGWWIIPMAICFFFMLFFRTQRKRWFFAPDSAYAFPHKSDNPKTAIEMLNKRYASGEITKEEFEQIKKDILA